MKPETQSIHAGHDLEANAHAITAPIHLSTTFERAADGSYPGEHVYSRDTNPNRAALETTLTALEGGAACAAFASGSVAAMSLLQAFSPQDHVIAPLDFYFGIRLVIKQIFVPWGLAVDFVDMTNLDAVRAAMRPNTRLLMLETPSNPMLGIADIAALADIAYTNNARLMVDNTIPTPIFQRPFELGADLVIHATTKYLSGHSDVISGAIITRQEDALWGRLKMIQQVGGAVPSPFDCWMASRGIQTLAHRVRAHAQSAQVIANYLEAHPNVEKVLYPGLPSHPQHELATRQMSGFGGLMSFLVKGGAAEAMQVAGALKLIARATSFGGTHTLIEHRASIEDPSTTTPQNLLRLSVGLEHVDDLHADLDQALAVLD